MFLVNSLFLLRFRAIPNFNRATIMLFFGCVFLCFTSCQEELPSLPEPDNLLSTEKMVEILTELSVLESDAQLKYVQTSRYADILSQIGDSLLKAKGITPEDFENNMDYYGSRQEEIIEIYKSVNANLVKQKKQLEEQVKKEQALKADTLQKNL